jgi:ABC-type uncharacterized transport system YnjBCD permease subunit
MAVVIRVGILIQSIILLVVNYTIVKKDKESWQLVIASTFVGFFGLIYEILKLFCSWCVSDALLDSISAGLGFSNYVVILSMTLSLRRK